MGIIGKFVSSKVSGYLLIGILVALAGAGYWFWSELKEFGSLTEKAEQQAETIEQQRATLERIAADTKAKDEALDRQSDRLKSLERATRLQQLAVMEAKKYADKALKECLAMRIADGMQFGPSAEGGSQDKARSDVDG